MCYTKFALTQRKKAYKQKYSLVIDCSMSVDKAKESAAIAAVNEHINQNVHVIGVGSGSTIIPAVKRIGTLFESIDC